MSLLPWFGSPFQSEIVVSDGEGEYDDEDEEDYFSSEPTLQSGVNMILRVQNLKYTFRDSDLRGQEFQHRRGSESPRKGGSSSPRKQSRESPSRAPRHSSQPTSNFKLNYFLHQPSTVYLDMSDIEKQVQCARVEIPHMFFARLRKLSSPQEQMQEKLNLKQDSGKPGKKMAGEYKGSPSVETPDSSVGEHSPPKSDVEQFCVVRVIVLDKRRKLCTDSYSSIVKRILDEQPLLKGHMIIPDMLRRFMKLELTSRVWLQVIKPGVTSTNAFSLYPLGNVVSNCSFSLTPLRASVLS